MPNTSPKPIPVIWLITAQDQLENACSQAGDFVGKSEVEQRDLLTKTTDDLNGLLRSTFKDRNPEVIVVLERLGGYAGRSDRHVLRVEIKLRPEESGDHETTEARIVKIGPCTEICREVIGRRTCERSANSRGRTLLRVRMGVCPRRIKVPQYPCTNAPKHGALGTIVYQDAYHTLRAARVVSLEKAFLNCVRWGTPSPQSVLGALEQVYQELQNHCYERAPAIRPTGKLQFILEQLENRLKPGFDRWKAGASIPGERRVYCREALPKDLFPFVDLIDFHARAFRQLHYQPELRFGRAHGDLHGRNVVVGRIDGEATWPAVFDFEDMGVNNFLAWDFVKMETELKVRALRSVFPYESERFVANVWQFETRLNETTETRDQQSFESWQDEVPEGSGGPEARLQALLLGLRRRAKRYLQVLGLPRTYRWLHEYYFFLACYAIYAGRFETYTFEECLAVYLGGSCAATRYTWGVERVYLSKDDGKHQAQERLNNTRWPASNPACANAGSPPPAQSPSSAQSPAPGVPSASTVASASSAASTPAKTAPNPWLRWDVRLEEMKILAHSKEEQFIEEAVHGLEKLSRQLPAAAEIVSELAFALIELAHVTGDERYYRRAVEELASFQERQGGSYLRDVELLCRSGRIWKDYGDRALEAVTVPPLADQSPRCAPPAPASDKQSFQLTPTEWYRISSNYYRRAYEASENYYPGINLATLEFLIGALSPPPANPPATGGEADFRKLAAEIKKRLLDDEARQQESRREWEMKKHPPSKADADKPPEPDDYHWRLASLGEACLLLGDPKAFHWYQEAWIHKKVANDPQAQDSIRRQAYRIITQQVKRSSGKSLRALHKKLRGLFR